MTRFFAGLLAMSLATSAACAEEIHCFFTQGEDDDTWKVTATMMGDPKDGFSFVQLNAVTETDQSRIVFGNWAGVAAPEDGLRIAQINGSLYHYQGFDAHMVEVLATPVVPDGAPTEEARRMWGKLIIDGKTVMSRPMEPVTYGGTEVISMRVGFHTMDGFENYRSNPVARDTFTKIEDTRVMGRLAIYDTNADGPPTAPTEDQPLVASFQFDGQEIMDVWARASSMMQNGARSYVRGCPDNRVTQ